MTDTEDPIAKARAGIEALRGLVSDAQIETMLAQLPGASPSTSGESAASVGWADAGGPTSPQQARDAQPLGFVPHPSLQAQETPATVAVRDNAGTINTGTYTETGGGAHIGGPVQVRGGHFIGRDLIQHIIAVLSPDEDAEAAKWAIGYYLDALATDLAGLRLGEIDAAADRPDPRRESLQLADIYVPLDTGLRIPKDRALADWLRGPAGRREGPGPDRRGAQAGGEDRRVGALEALAAHRELTLIGKPGSGKSTFGAHVLLALAQAWQGRPESLAALGPAWTHGPLFPIRVVLRRFAAALPPGDAPASAGDLWDFIARDLADAGLPLPPAAVRQVRRIAADTGALVLFDGLDECGDPAARARVAAGVRAFIKTAGHRCRFILTARPYAWPGGPDPDRGVYALADLDDDQVAAFIRAWYDALVRRRWRLPGEVERKAADLLAARHRPRWVSCASRTPSPAPWGTAWTRGAWWSSTSRGAPGS